MVQLIFLCPFSHFMGLLDVFPGCFLSLFLQFILLWLNQSQCYRKWCQSVCYGCSLLCLLSLFPPVWACGWCLDWKTEDSNDWDSSLFFLMEHRRPRVCCKEFLHFWNIRNVNLCHCCPATSHWLWSVQGYHCSIQHWSTHWSFSKSLRCCYILSLSRCANRPFR